MDFDEGVDEADVEFARVSAGGDAGGGNRVPNESRRAGSTFESATPAELGDTPAGLTSESGDAERFDPAPVAVESAGGRVDEKGDLDSVLDRVP